MRSLWRTYGPSFHWVRFRLHGEPPNGRWQPIRIMQIFGGRWWSLSLTRTGPTRPAEPAEVTPDQLDRAMIAYRRGARMDTWEQCVTHDADRTLSGLRAALAEIGFDVARRGPGS